jgi:hypothetical protein
VAGKQMASKTRAKNRINIISVLQKFAQNYVTLFCGWRAVEINSCIYTLSLGQPELYEPNKKN